ncbi:MAG: hypothetical protein KC502_02570 [Myxococcales bacterium]|nr:hypothetical protein [Myxococcales bacterium]
MFRKKTPPQTTGRCPRIGVIHRGAMIAERNFARRCDISLGRRIDASIQLDDDDLPEKMDVLRLIDGNYHLVLPADPTARLTLRGSPVSNVTVTDGGQRLVPIERAAGGSLQIGDLVIMFQLVRPSAEAMQVHESTVLRVGLVFEGRLISDRVFDDNKKVCIGRGRKDRIVLDADYDGPSICFRRHRDGSATLIADAGAALRVALPDRSPEDSNALRSLGHARSRGKQLEVHLPTGSRGRAQLGPYTVLYQVLLRRSHVPAMPSQGPIAELATAVWRDPVWSASLALAAVLVCGVLGQAMVFHDNVGRFQAAAAPEDEDRNRLWEVAVAELEPPPKPEVAPAIAPLAPKEAAKPDPKVKPKRVAKKDKRVKKPKAPKPSAGDQTVDPTERQRNARGRVLSGTVAGVFKESKMFAATDDDDGEVQAKVFGGGGESDDPGEDGPGHSGVKLKGASGGGSVERVVAKKAGFKRSRRIAGLKRRAPRKEAPVKIETNPIETSGSKDVSSKVGRVIARKRNAVRRCYDKALRKDASISGKVRVSFTLGTAGTITSAVVSGVTGDLQRCIKSVFTRARGLPLIPSPQFFKQSFILSGRTP